MSFKIGTMKDLRLGDRVKCFDTGSYEWGTVVAVYDDMVTVVRPYIHTGDFACLATHPNPHPNGDKAGRRVLHYIGTEVFNLYSGVRTYTIEPISEPIL